MSRHSGWFAHLLLACTLAVGVETAWMLLVGAVASASPSWWLGFDDYEYAFFLRDGTAVIARQETGESGKLDYRDPQGNVIAEEATRRQSGTVLLPGGRAQERSLGGLNWADRIKSFCDYQTPAGYWHFVHDGQRDGAGYFVGFNSETNKQIGYIGRSGAIDHAPSRSEQFAVDGAALRANRIFTMSSYTRPGYDPVTAHGAEAPDQFDPWVPYMIAENRIYEVNLRDRVVRVAINLMPSPVLAIAFDYQNGDGFDWSAKQLIVRTQGEVLVYNSKLELMLTVPIPQQIRDESWINYFRFDDGRIALRVQRSSIGSPGTIHSVVYRFDRSGEFERTDEFDTRGAPDGISMLSIAAPGPILAAFSVATVALSAMGAVDPSAGWYGEFLELLRRFAPALTAICLISTALAWLCYRRQTQFAVSKAQRLGWTIFVWLLGPPGYVGYHCSRRWPVVDGCPACSQLVPMDRPSCAACGKPFPPPARTGTEVFA